MKRQLSLLIIPLLISCSGGDDTTQIEMPSRISFRIEGGNVDLNSVVYFVNNDYENPYRACYSSSVRSGDTIRIAGGPDLFYLKAITSNNDAVDLDEYILHKNGTNLMQEVRYESCNQNNSTTVMANPPLWKNDSDNQPFIIIN